MYDEHDILFELLTLTVEINKQGTKRYFNKQGQMHRVYGPAYIGPSGAEEWYYQGVKHRIDGPAATYSNTKHFFLDGKHYKEEKYWKEVAKRVKK